MVGFDPCDMTTVELTSQEQSALLQHCYHLPDEIRRMLFSARDGMLTLTAHQAAVLCRAIQLELDAIKDPNVGDALVAAYNKLTADPTMQATTEQPQRTSFRDLKEAQAHADKVRQRHNNSPDPQLGGLTPNQVRRLLYSDWDDPDGSLKLADDISFDHTSSAPLFHNAGALLNELSARTAENTATARGNLTRKVVAALLETFRIDSAIVKEILALNKVLNEPDVSVIWTTRLICELAGLIRKRKNKILVTTKGRRLMAPEHAGKLYRLLFVTYMRKFNIGFYDRLPDFDSLQLTMPYTLYQLDRLARREISLKKIYRRIILPAVLDELDQFATDFISTRWIVRTRVIDPLEFVGLIRGTREKLHFYPEIVSFRTTDLFHKFVAFDL